MPLFNWPYTNIHNLNLDWIIKKIKNVETAESNTAASEEAAAGSAASAAASQEAAALSETNAAGSAAQAKQYYDNITENVSTLVTGWMDEHITPTTPPVDDTLTIQGAAADAKKTGDEITDLKDAFDNFLDIVVTRGEKVDTGWKFKADGTVTPASDFDIYAVDLGLGGGEIYALVKYAENALSYAQFQNTKYTSASDTERIIGGPFNNPVSGKLEVPTVSTGAVYFMFNVKNTDTESGVLTSDTVDTLTETAEKTGTFEDKINRIVDYPVLRNGSAGNKGNANAVCPAQIIPTNNADKITIVINKELGTGATYHRFQLTTYSVDSGAPEDNNANRIIIDANNDMNSNGFTLTKDVYGDALGFVCGYYERNADAFVPVRITDFNEGDYAVFYQYEYTEIASENYVLSSDFTKHKVKAVKLGTISAPQSFVKYNDKYYSSDGNNIYVQNDSFVLERTVPLVTGHANAMMLGTAPYAYISGWNDQKVYKVNLDTVTLEEEITLPTTGYTTCAVDDVKGLIYIFQRADASVVEPYNFITYDYVNSEIISTKKIFAFGAIQACDLFNDRIMMVYGLGTNAVPNGYKVMNTEGNIIADYFLPQFSVKEPEGVCIDRESHQLMVGFYGASDQDIYTISI